MIRRASGTEVESLREVRNVSAQSGCRHVYSSEQLAVWLARPLPEKMQVLVKDGYVLVAEEGRAIVGYGALDPESREVEAVFVLPSYGGRGIGRALLAALEAMAVQVGLKSLHLSASLNAVCFYKSAGYTSNAKGELPLNDAVFLGYESMEKSLEGQ